MPRKQRFKPSRKPQSTQAVANPMVDDRKEISSDQSTSSSSQVEDDQPQRELERT